MKHYKHIFKALLLVILVLLPFQSFAQRNAEASVLDAAAQRKIDHYFYRALHAKALGQYAEAFDFLRHVYALDPTNADVLVELGTFFSAMREREIALAFLQRAVLLDETNFDHQMALAGFSQEIGLVQDAINIYTRLLTLFPDRVEVYFALASAHAESGNLQEAINAFHQLEQIVGVSEQISFSKIRLHFMMGNREGAVEEVRKLIREFPGDPRFYVIMGDFYLDDNQTENALRYYEKAAEIDPDFPPLLVSMIRFYEKTNNTKAIQAELRRAITNPELDLESKMEFLGEYLAVLQQTGQELSAVNPLFETLFVQHPDDTELSFVFANILMIQGDEERAIYYFERFIRENPENPAGYEQLLRIAITNESYEKLIAVSAEALKRFPEEPQFYFYLGIAKFQQNRYAEALEVFQNGLQNAVFPSAGLKSMFLGQIGDLHHKLGNQEAAFEYYGKALELDPMNIHVLNNYSYFLALARRDLQRAERMSAITLQAEPLNPVFLDTYGWVLYQQGAYAIARIYLERAREHARDNPSAVIYEQLGDALYKTGEPERAREMWKRAKELGGDNEFLIRKIETGEYHSRWTDKEVNE